MDDRTADESDDDSDDEGDSIVWQSVSGDDADDTDADDRAGEDESESTAEERETVDLEALIAEDPAESKDESADRTDESADRMDQTAEGGKPSPGEADRKRSDRLWNRFGSEEGDSSRRSRSSADAGEGGAEDDAGGEEPGDGDGTASADTTDSGRLWNESGGTGDERTTRKGAESDEDATVQAGETTDAPEKPSGGTSFDHLLERSSSGPGRSRPAGSPTVETDLEAFFGDLEEFDRATSGSQVLVISPRGHAIGDEVCSHFLTAGSVSNRNAMYVTAVESPAERLEICRNNDDWAGGKVAVIELGDTGSDTDDLGSVGGEAVTYKRVNSPKNLSKAGLLITQTLKQWSSSDQPSVLCFHTLTAISGYVQNQTLFQFLFTLQAKLNSFGVTGHYHMDANRHDQQEINTLKTLFDLVVTVTQNGEIEVE